MSMMISKEHSDICKHQIIVSTFLFFVLFKIRNLTNAIVMLLNELASDEDNIDSIVLYMYTSKCNVY